VATQRARRRGRYGAVLLPVGLSHYNDALAGGTVGDFLIRRLCRIVPLAWLGLVLGLWALGAPRADYLPSFLFYANVPPYFLTDATAHYWSLCVEVQFYAAIALICGLCGRRGLLVLPFAAIGITALRIHEHMPVAIFTPYRVDEILSGAILALAYAGQLGPWLPSAIKRLNPYVMIALLVASADPRTGFIAYLRPYAAAALVGRTLLGPETALDRPLRSRSLAYLATVSYALYVVHGLLSHTWLGSGSKLVKYAKRPLLLAVTFALAHVSTLHYEARWIAFGKRLSARLAASGQRAAAIEEPALEGQSASLRRAAPPGIEFSPGRALGQVATRTRPGLAPGQ